MRVRLYTHDALPRNFVAEKEIPNYVTGRPDVLIWGNRVFKPHGEDVPPDAVETNYVECFAHIILD